MLFGIQELCMEEFANCEEQSAGIFYVLISMDKYYGFRLLPWYIPQNEMERLKREMSTVEKAPVDSRSTRLIQTHWTRMSILSRSM